MIQQKSQLSADWPQNWQFGSTTLSFSASYLPESLEQRQKQKSIRQAGKLFLSLIVGLGIFGLVFSALQGLHDHNRLFFLQRSAYNLAFWVGLFLSGYLWAQNKQQQLNQQRLNLLRWDAQQPAQLDVYELFNDEAKAIWDAAAAGQIRRHGAQNHTAIPVSAIDLMLALLGNKSVRTLFYRLSVDPEDLKIFLKNYELLADGNNGSELYNIPFTAFAESIKLHNRSIDPLMLLCALKLELPDNHILQDVFFNIDVTLEDLEICCSWIFQLRLLEEEIKLTRQLSRFKPTDGNRGLTALPTPYLDHFSTDLSLAARYGALPLAFGRGCDLQDIFRLLDSGKKNLVIKGNIGTGRTTLLNELAYKMTTEQVPASLSDMRLVKLESSGILGNPGRAEQVLLHALKEADRSGNILLVIPHIHELAKTITSSGVPLLDILTDFLQSHDITALATTTNEDYTDYLRKSSNFEQIFASYELKALSRADILLACCVKASVLEHKNKCLFRYDSIKQAVELTDRYIKDSNQPQKAIGVLVEAASRAKGEKNKVVSSELIQTIVSNKTHIPSEAFSQDESDKLLHLEDELSKYIIGQTTAITAVAEGLRRARSGLNDTNRPLASFLFLGPTGVGKTEIARVLSKIYFGEEKFLLRLDMSEYQGEQGLEKLIGSEYAKTDSPMVKHLKNYPFCLLLLDEFEKASPQVLNLFLQILEDGRLTSGQGELIDLTHCLIIATSNAGSADIQKGLKAGETIDHIKAKLLDRLLLKYYPPELLNRFDGVIIFSTLSPENVAAIVNLQLETLKHQLLAKGVKIDFSLKVARDIADKAYDPALGARPIRRYIQDHIETFIAKLLLQKRLTRGSQLQIDAKDGQLTIT